MTFCYSSLDELIQPVIINSGNNRDGGSDEQCYSFVVFFLLKTQI